MIADRLGFDADDNLYTHDVERALVGMSFEQIQSHYPNEIVCGVCTRPSEEEMAETESANSETRWLHDVPPNVQHRKRQLECVDGLKLRLGVPHADWRATAGDRLLLLRSTQRQTSWCFADEVLPPSVADAGLQVALHPLDRPAPEHCALFGPGDPWRRLPGSVRLARWMSASSMSSPPPK